jgi:hypothetical protein
MSHKAASWLADIPPGDLSNSEFRVLFYLCDVHNPSRGCFPSQAFLRAKTGVSNGTLNNALKSMEERGLIQRHVTYDAGTHRKRPTRYKLGFELDDGTEPSPETGDGNPPKPSPETGDGAISKKRPVPSPKNGKSHLLQVGDKPVKEPVNKNAGATGASQNPMVVRDAERVADAVRSGRPDAFADAQPWVRSHIIATQMLTDAERQAVGFSETKGVGHD